MTDQPPPSGDRSRGLWVLVGVLLVPPIVLPLIVPIYDRTGPSLWGFPFFFWFQFLLIIVSALLTAAAYRVWLEVQRRDRAARPGRRPGATGWEADR